MMKDFFNKPKMVSPGQNLPSISTDLNNIIADKPTIIWFGHSSYLIRSKNVSILVDPVFSGNASPVSFFGKSFNGTDIYSPEDMPLIDFVIITHDHYDHLDFKTILALKNKTQYFYTPLGVGAHLEYWGIEPQKIVEMDWWDADNITDHIELIAAPARHFSGRGFKRGKTLWASYVLKIHGYKIMLGGDSGYDTHFKEIGDKFGPFDLSILEAGQYGKDWPFIHMFPEQTIQAALDLQSKKLFPVHWGKFVLSHHIWNEPIKKVVKQAEKINLYVATPQIGEPVIIDSLYSSNYWWDF